MATVHVLRGTSVTPTETFSVNGVPADLDTGVPTVTATYPNGTTLTPAPVASGAWTGRTTGQYRIVLDAQAECAILDLVWVGVIGGKTQTLRSRVEWVGDLLFTVAEARAFRVGGSTPLASTADADLLEARATVTDEFQTICGQAFVPRYARQILAGSGTDTLILGNLRIQRIISASVGGVALDAGALAALTVPSVTGLLTRTTGSTWTWGAANVVVEYVHGFDQVPGDIKLAALRRVAMLLNPSALGSTISSYTDAAGGTYSFDPAGRRVGAGDTQWFGVPAIDSVLNRPAYQAVDLAVA